ncbi:MAG TPA: hypothetical protein VK783_16055, partial [Bacteroidia bacterium]|nr:hypothetical protein [Bacteroidia bacterium]
MRKLYPSESFLRRNLINTVTTYSVLMMVLILFSVQAVKGQASLSSAGVHKKPVANAIGPVAAAANNSTGQTAAGTGTRPNEKPGLRPKWIAYFDDQKYIENKGQFNAQLDNGNEILFGAVLGGDVKMYLMPNGVTYKLRKFKTVDADGKEDGDEEDDDHKGRQKNNDPDAIHIPVIHLLSSVWEGSNPNVQIETSDQAQGYNTYAEGLNKTGTIKAFSYKKVTYKNMYPGIDIEYTFPDKTKEGIKYAIIIHPGADLSQVKLKYTGSNGITIDKAGNAQITSEISTFTDHAPVSSYQEGGTANIVYTVNGDEVGFAVKGDYDNTKTLVIDPWTQTNLGFPYNDGYDVDYDNAGHVYVGGGYDWYQISQFSPTGALNWTYGCFANDNSNSGYDQTVWGGFAVDKGTSYTYAVEGFNVNGAWSEKVDPSGNFVARYTGTGTFNEMWRAQFNSCTNAIAIGGGGTNAGNNDQVAILNETMASLTPLNPLGVTGPGHDVVGLSMDPTGSYCYMAVAQSTWWNNGSGYTGPDQRGIANNYLFKVPVPALTPTSFALSDGYSFSEDNSVTYVADGLGDANAMNSLTASPSWLYMYDGKTLTQYSKTTGGSVASINVSGGSRYNQGGIAADGCDNVYVGSGSDILAYGSNIAGGVITTTPTAAKVYGLTLGYNDATLYACGGPNYTTGYNGTGYVEEFTNAISTVASTVSSITNTTCGFTNGSATASLSFCGGGTPAGTTYSWSPGGQTTQTATGLTGGVTYTVTMSLGCGQQYTATAYIGTSSAAVPTGVSA